MPSKTRNAAPPRRNATTVAAIRTELRRAVRMSVLEASAERAKRRELDEKMTQLAAAQVITEENLQRLLDIRSTNGRP